MWTRLLRSRHLTISDSWASKPNVVKGQMNLLVIQTIFLHTVPKTGCLFIFILIACKTSYPSLLCQSFFLPFITQVRYNVFQKTSLFITLNARPVQVGQAMQLSSQRCMSLAVLTTSHWRHLIIHLSLPLAYTFFKNLNLISFILSLCPQDPVLWSC